MRVAALLIAITLAAGEAAAATLGEAKTGFSADRNLVVNGQAYHGKMWTMPGKERHEQNLNGIPAIFILASDSPIGEAVLPQLHTVVQFVVPPELQALSTSRLKKRAVGHDTVGGIATTRYTIDETVPEGHGSGTLWLSAEGIPMKLDGSFTNRKGELGSVHWELSNVRIGPQPASLFEPPANFTVLPAEAVAPLLGLRLKGKPH